MLGYVPLLLSVRQQRLGVALRQIPGLHREQRSRAHGVAGSLIGVGKPTDSLKQDPKAARLYRRTLWIVHAKLLLRSELLRIPNGRRRFGK
jgi:hypothetical protein